MASKTSMAHAQGLPQTAGKPAAMSRSEAKLHEEDGWIFSEQPGQGVKCLGRTSEISQPYLSRHNYPSN